MVPDVVIAMVRTSLEAVKLKRDQNTAALERIDAERAQYARANELLNSQIAQTELWLERATQEVMPKPIGPAELHNRADSAMRRR